MSGLFIFLFLLSLIILPVVIIKPNLLEKITKRKFTRPRAGLLLGGITLALFILIGLTTKPTVKSISEQKAEAITSKPTFTPTTVPQTQKQQLSTLKPTVIPTQQTKTWHKVLFDIGEWNKNDGETTTKEFQITSDKWRIKWAKRELTMMSVEVFDSNGKPYGSLPDEPFTFDFGETEGILDFTGIGTYSVHFIGGTNKSAGEWDITVEELK